MNIFRFSTVVLLFFSFMLQAIEIKTSALTAKLDPKGAVLTSLTVKGEEWICSVKKNGSFTDRIGQNASAQIQALTDTAAIVFNLKEYSVTSKGPQAVFSSCIGTIPGLRLEKRYSFGTSSPTIEVEYTFKNIGSVPIPLSLYTRSFFRTPDADNVYYYPLKGNIAAIAPGEVSFPVKLPAQTFLAVANRAGAGFIQKFPADDTAGLLNWRLKGGYSQEYLSSQQILQPGKTRVIKLECFYSGNVLADLKKNAPKAQKLKGELPVQVDRMCRIKPKASLMFYRSIPTPQGTFLDCTFRRQPADAWYAVEIPQEKEKSPIAVYIVENGVTASDRPLEYCRKGKNIVIKIPGFSPRSHLSVEQCKFENDFVNYAKGKRWYGPLTVNCRILFDHPGGKEIKAEDIPPEGALIRNGSMEQISERKASLPAHMLYAFHSSFKGGVEKEKNGNKFLRIQKYLTFNFFPAHRKEYTLSFKLRSLGGGGFSRIFIQFYDKNGQYLAKERLIVYAGRNAFPWKSFQRRFYIPEHVSFLRILFNNGNSPGQYLDIDDLKLTVPPVTEKTADTKGILRDEMLKLWKIPLDLLENISHELVTPHKKWFKLAAAPVENILFLSGVSEKITFGRRQDIVEWAQRMDMKYRHIPLIPKIKNVVRAYSVYPTYFYPALSDYTMCHLSEIKKLPGAVCFTGVDFKKIPDKRFLSLMHKWQKAGVNFLFYRCSNIPEILLGKPYRPSFSMLLPEMSPGPRKTPGSVKFYRNAKSVTAVITHISHRNSLLPDSQSKAGRYDIPMPYSFEFPWWEYSYLQNLHVLRYIAGVKKTAALTAAPGGVAVRAEKDFSGTLEISVESMHREVILEKKIPVKAAAGTTQIIKDDLELPGGVYVANLRLLDSRSLAVDAGAVKIERRQITPLSLTMKNKENIVPYPQKAEFTVSAPQAPAGSFVEVELFNQRNEIFYRTRQKSKETLSFAAEIKAPRTFLNYVRARLICQGKLLATVTQEFSVPQIPREMNEFYGFINAGPSSGSPIKDLGFDFAITGDPRWLHTPCHIRRLRTMDIHPIPRRGDEKLFRPYRDDVKSAPVRNPCFSSPEFHKNLQKDTRFMVENSLMRYYDVHLLWAGDEMFLGRSVCTSPSCLAGFRKQMEKSFRSIDALNKNWGTSFKSFSEVFPQQLEDLKDKKRLGPWLDHKMYMTKVFAENFFGKARDELAKYIPDVKIGPTGTQVPGYGYNWHELMKYCRIVGYYSGVQTKVVHDLTDAPLMAGQCGGGYTHGHLDYEPYNYNTMWRTFLNGGNLAYHYYGCAISGDGSATSNMRFFTTSLRELKSGIGKLYLSARPRYEIGVLYSQPSLFAAIGSCGQSEWQNSQTSWYKLLDDLRVSARFFSYEELAEKGVPREFKVVILPFALALSEKEIASLARFAAAGGKVIADCSAGIFDEHGRKRSDQELREKMKFLTNMNFSIARYSFVQLGGTGGEISSSGAGDEKFVRQCRQQIGDLLKSQGIHPFVRLQQSDGKEFACMAKLRSDGETKIYGFHREPADITPGRFKESDGQKVKVTLPESGYVYDIRNKKYLGKTSAWQMNLIPGKSLVYGVVPRKFESLELTLPASVERGESFKVTAAVSPAASPQVFRLEIAGPDGKELKQYAVNFRCPKGIGTREIFIPFNAERGKYKVRIIHVLSGLSAVKTVKVR